jgi:uncharacterized membrane protein
MLQWYVFAIISAFLAAGSLIFRKEGLLKVHAMEFATARTFVCAICALVILPFFITQYSVIEIVIIYVVALLSTAGILFFSKSMRHMEISTAAPLLNLMPAFLVIWAFIFLSESINAYHILGIGMLILGTYVLEMDSKFHHLLKPIKEMRKSKYFHFVLFAVVFFSFSALLDRVVLLKYSTPMRFLALVWVFVAINFLIVHSIKYDGWRGVIHSFRKTRWLVILAGIFAFLSTLFYYQAAAIAFIALVVPVKRLSTLIATIIGGEILHDKHLLHKIIACAIMVGGATLVILV